MLQPLEKEEIKYLKKGLKNAFLYGFITLAFFAYLFYLSVSGNVNISPETVTFLGITVTVFVIWLLGYDYYKDLKSGKKEIIEKKLEIHEDERKIKKSKVVALVNAWGKGKKSDKNFLIHIDYSTFEVNEELMKKAEKKGTIKLSYSVYSKKLLKIDV